MTQKQDTSSQRLLPTGKQNPAAAFAALVLTICDVLAATIYARLPLFRGPLADFIATLRTIARTFERMAQAPAPRAPALRATTPRPIRARAERTRALTPRTRTAPQFRRHTWPTRRTRAATPTHNETRAHTPARPRRPVSPVSKKPAKARGFPHALFVPYS